jgi:hypothetical protein
MTSRRRQAPSRSGRADGRPRASSVCGPASSRRSRAHSPMHRMPTSSGSRPQPGPRRGTRVRTGDPPAVPAQAPCLQLLALLQLAATRQRCGDCLFPGETRRARVDREARCGSELDSVTSRSLASLCGARGDVFGWRDVAAVGLATLASEAPKARRFFAAYLLPIVAAGRSNKCRAAHTGVKQ